VKLWDPRAGASPANCVTTLHGHKGTVSQVRRAGGEGIPGVLGLFSARAFPGGGE